MNNKQLEFFKELKTLSTDELLEHESAGVGAMGILNICGIAVALCMVCNISVISLVISIPVLLYLGAGSQNCSETLIEIRRLLDK